MKVTLVFASLLLIANIAIASVIYYPSPYLNPYFASPYNPRPVLYPTDIDNCPLQSSYYDANGNWVPPQRVCPSTDQQIHIHIDGASN